jgi:hypothetical protein
LRRGVVVGSRLAFGDANDTNKDSDQSSAGVDSLGFGGGDVRRSNKAADMNLCN